MVPACMSVWPLLTCQLFMSPPNRTPGSCHTHTCPPCSQRDRFRARVQEVEGHLAALAGELKKARRASGPRCFAVLDSVLSAVVCGALCNSLALPAT